MTNVTVIHSLKFTPPRDFFYFENSDASSKGLKISGSMITFLSWCNCAWSVQLTSADPVPLLKFLPRLSSYNRYFIKANYPSFLVLLQINLTSQFNFIMVYNLIVIDQFSISKTPSRNKHKFVSTCITQTFLQTGLSRTRW